MEQMKLASDRGIPPMRPLFFDFDDDKKVAEVEDQFLFGPDLLVAPITDYRARDRTVYLPAQTAWIDAWTGEKILRRPEHCRRCPDRTHPRLCAPPERRTVEPLSRFIRPVNRACSRYPRAPVGITIAI